MAMEDTTSIELPIQLTLTALNALQTLHTSKQKMINAATIQEGSTAQIVAENLYQEILKYQSVLPDTEDVAMSIVNFNQTTTILVDSIGYIGYNMVRFGGEGCFWEAIGIDTTYFAVEFSFNGSAETRARS